jgi:ribosomal protein S18 acetylase RimI-like enzyme
LTVPELNIRPATTGDDRFFQEVEFTTTWSSILPADRERLTAEAVKTALQETHESLLNRPKSRVFIAQTPEGRRAGLLWLGVNRNLVSGEDEAWVYNVTVLPEFEGRGIGRELLAFAERLAADEGYRVLGLMVSEHNARARDLYERRGFETTNRLMRKTLR